MAHKYDPFKINTPAGVQTVCCSSEENKKENIDRLLEYWTDYCNKNWMVENHEAIDAPEKKVKWFLDGLANMMLYNNAPDVVTPYKASKIKEKEVPLSTLLDSQEDHGTLRAEKVIETEEPKRETTKEKVPRFPTRFEKMTEIKRTHIGCNLTFCNVNTENMFTYNGKQYRISSSVTVYNPTVICGEPGYKMDRILVCNTKGSLEFYDQSVNPIGVRQIYNVGSEPIGYDTKEEGATEHPKRDT